VTVAGQVLVPGEFDLGVESPDGVTAAALSSGDAVVVLDTEVTDDLTREGLARDVVRQVQQARRDAGLVVTDRIRLILDGDDDLMVAIRAHETHVAGQVLAVELVYDAIDPSADGATEATVEGATLRFSLAVA
jgi:isoleucyl-tRNA synthetase